MKKVLFKIIVPLVDLAGVGTDRIIQSCNKAGGLVISFIGLVSCPYGIRKMCITCQRILGLLEA